MILLVTSMQDQLEQLNANMERLIEQIRIANKPYAEILHGFVNIGKGGGTG